MPELSNGGSGSRTSRSGRSNSKVQTSAGPTTTVQIQNQKLATQNSQSIMSGGLAEANAIGKMGQAMSGFFGAIAKVDSDLVQVERAEQLRVASESKAERNRVKAEIRSEAKYQHRKKVNKKERELSAYAAQQERIAQAKRDTTTRNVNRYLAEVEADAKQEAHNLEVVENIGVVNTQVNSLFQAFDENVVRDFNVETNEIGFAQTATDFFEVNFVPTGNDILDQKIKNDFDQKVVPLISKFSEERETAHRTNLMNGLSTEVATREMPMYGHNFADDIARVVGISPSLTFTEASSKILQMYVNSAKLNGKFKPLARFLSDEKVIPKGDGFVSFSTEFPEMSANLFDAGYKEHQATSGQEADQNSTSLMNEINSLTPNADSTAEIAVLQFELIQHSDRYGDEVGTNKMISALSKKVEKIAEANALSEQWNKATMGSQSLLPMPEFKSNQQAYITQNPASNYTDTTSSAEDYATISTNAVGMILNHKDATGIVSDKVKYSLSSMLTSVNDPVSRTRGYQMLQKLDAVDSAISADILKGNEHAAAFYSAVKEGYIDLSVISEDFDLVAQLQDVQLIKDTQAATFVELGVETKGEMFASIMDNSSVIGLQYDDNDHMETIAAALGLDEDDIFISPNGAVAKEFLALHTSMTITDRNSGGSLDADGIAAQVWKQMLPNLSSNLVNEGRSKVVFKQDAKPLPPLLSVIDGNVSIQMPEGNNQPNPLDRDNPINASDNMNTAVQAWSAKGLVEGNLGFVAMDDGSGQFALTTDSGVGREKLFLGTGVAFDLGTIVKTGGAPASLGQGLASAIADSNAPKAKESIVTFTGDKATDEAALAEVAMVEGSQFVAVYPANTSQAAIADGSAEAMGYNIAVFPHMAKTNRPSTYYTDAQLKTMSKGNNKNDMTIRSYHGPAFDKTKRNGDHSFQEDLNQQIRHSKSQSAIDQSALLQEGVMNELQLAGKVSDKVGLTVPLKAGFVPDITASGIFNAAENASWFIQDAYIRVKEHMGTESDPEYTSQRFEMIAEREAWRSGSYWDGVKSAPNGKGYRTVGYGYNMDSVGHKDLFIKTLQVNEKYFDDVHSGRVEITEAQGRKLFDAAVDEAESVVDNRLKGVDLNHQQRLALVSMAYNSPKLIGQNLVGHLKGGRMEKAVEEILYKSNGSRMLGLYNRRYEEALTFVGANRIHGIPSYLAYMATVLPEKYAAQYAASVAAGNENTV